jgi:hypothetical protein
VENQVARSKNPGIASHKRILNLVAESYDL